MRTSGVLAVLSTAFLGRAMAENAPVIQNNPAGVSYQASLPEQPFFAEADLEGNVKGSVLASSAPGGEGVKFTVQFQNLPKSGGPFLYHIHETAAVNGNCTSTGAHLDPYLRGEDPACDASEPATCQVGDLSGKHGKITSDPFTVEYTDDYISTQPGSNAFFGDLSFVIHYANKTRLTCANFSRSSSASNSTILPTGTATPAGTGVFTASSPSGTGQATSSTSALPGAASVNRISMSLMGGVVAAMVFLL